MVPRGISREAPERSRRVAQAKAVGERPGNRILASLPEPEFSRLRPLLTSVALPVRHVLQRAHEPVRFVYFPNGGVCSVTVAMSTGTMVEVATVGDEGMLGIEALFTAAPVARGEVLVQVPGGTAARLGTDEFRRALAGGGALARIMGRYAEAKLTEIFQSAACNALHPVSQRCARWLLMTHDRTHRRDFSLSQEFLAVMLGVSRAVVNDVASRLQAGGIIRYRRAHVAVLDRERLEAASCECYLTIRNEFEELARDANKLTDRPRRPAPS